MRSKAVMQQALQSFEGSYVIVSHDRDFLDPIVNKVVEFSRGRIKTYPGNVSEYIYTKQKENAAAAAATQNVVQAKKGESQVSDKERKRLEAEQRQKRYKKTKPVQEKIEKIEKVVAAKEQQKAGIEQVMADPGFFKDGEKVKLLTAQYKAIEAELSQAYFTWNELTRELERLTQEFEKDGKGEKANP
jgi:ATP-binding cassette subfamily F protein 3